MSIRPIHPDFRYYLEFKEQELIECYRDLREYILELFPQSTELLYHTHALTSVYSHSSKLGDAFCMIPIYSRHLNLGFNQGTLLPDPQQLLKGTGKLIRHIPISLKRDYRNEHVEALLNAAEALAGSEMTKPAPNFAQTISKIKR